MQKYNGNQVLVPVYDDNNFQTQVVQSGGGGYVAPPVVKQVVTIQKPQPVKINPPAVVKPVTMASTPAVLPAGTFNLINQALGAATGLDISTPIPGIMGADVTVKSSRTYWWVLVLVVVTIAGVIGLNGQKGYKR
jgi:hypothetical protein